MMQNPFVLYEIEKMRHEDQARRVRRYWELGLDQIEQPGQSRWVNFARLSGSSILAWSIGWLLQFILREPL